MVVYVCHSGTQEAEAEGYEIPEKLYLITGEILLQATSPAQVLTKI